MKYSVVDRPWAFLLDIHHPDPWHAPVASTTVFSTPDDGRRKRPKNVECICGNKMPTRCNRGFYWRSYCLLNMFRASLCPSSGAQEYYTVVAACGISCCGFSSSLSGVELRVICPVSRMHHRQQPLYNTLELLMMGIVMHETCWASNTICNKNLCCI